MSKYNCKHESGFIESFDMSNARYPDGTLIGGDLEYFAVCVDCESSFWLPSNLLPISVNS